MGAVIGKMAIVKKLSGRIELDLKIGDIVEIGNEHQKGDLYEAIIDGVVVNNGLHLSLVEIIEDGKPIDSKYGTFITEKNRFYMLEMTKAMTGQNARENALVKRRISKADFFNGISCN